MSTNLETLRGMVDTQNRKTNVMAIAVLVGLVALLVTLNTVAYLISDMVTKHVTALLSLDVLIIVAAVALLAQYHRRALANRHLDSRDMSRLFDSDHPLAMDALHKTKERGFYTYADLDKDLEGYERIQSAVEYAHTGVNRKFKVRATKENKPVRMPLRSFKRVLVTIVPLFLTLAQVGVIAGVIPTINQLITGNTISALSLHMSLKEIVLYNVLPKAITVLTLQVLKIVLRKI
uniref:hypothetical protein n=1 Tax=Serratia entomophila TaxID=42906 RepID=UPI001F4C10E9|nr:hypothetical protein [Serratia entomophila]